jgi:hypothetical protein
MKGSPLLASGRIPKITAEGMYEIEQKVLDYLKKKWEKQPHKREHFIISEDEEDEFVGDVRRLYDYYTDNRHLLM